MPLTHTAAHASPPEAAVSGADVVVAIRADEDGEVLVQAESVATQLERAFPSRRPAVLAFSRRPGGVQAVPVRDRGSIPTDADDEVTLLLRAADALAVPAVLLSAVPREEDGAWLRPLLDPLLADSHDVVCPSFARRPFDGAIQSGVAVPLTAALFGIRLWQPIGRDVGLSLRACRQLLADGGWLEEIARDGPDLWLGSPALRAGLRVCQACLGPRPERTATPRAVSSSLATVLTAIFRGLERHAAAWQRVAGPAPIPAFGPAPWLAGGAMPLDRSGAEAFRLAYRELSGVWRSVFAPATLLALQRAVAAPDATFRVDDAAWARALCDLAVAWHLEVMERGQLLQSAAPVYLGWFAGFARDVAAVAPERVEERIDALCAEVERSRRYLVGRWRWPDSFAP